VSTTGAEWLRCSTSGSSWLSECVNDVYVYKSSVLPSMFQNSEVNFAFLALISLILRCYLSSVAWYCNGSVSNWWPGCRISPDALPGNGLGQVVHAHVPLSPSSIILYWLHRRESYGSYMQSLALLPFIRQGRVRLYRVAYNTMWSHMAGEVSAAHCQLRTIGNEDEQLVTELWESAVDCWQFNLFIYHKSPNDVTADMQQSSKEQTGQVVVSVGLSLT